MEMEDSLFIDSSSLHPKLFLPILLCFPCSIYDHHEDEGDEEDSEDVVRWNVLSETGDRGKNRGEKRGAEN